MLILICLECPIDFRQKQKVKYFTGGVRQARDARDDGPEEPEPVQPDPNRVGLLPTQTTQPRSTRLRRSAPTKVPEDGKRFQKVSTKNVLSDTQSAEGNDRRRIRVFRTGN